MPAREVDPYNLENRYWRRLATHLETKEMVEAMEHLGLKSRNQALLVSMKLFIETYGPKRKTKH